MSTPANVHAGLVAKMSLKQYVQKFKDRNPDLTADDADIAAFYLRKFPDDTKTLDAPSQKLATDLVEGGEQGIRNFYQAFGSKVMKGVALKNAPEFVQPTLKKYNTKYTMGKPGDMVIAHVNEDNPRYIFADMPIAVNPGIQAHEATHVYQLDLRNPMSTGISEHPNYDYGDWEGLLAARRQGKTIRDFTDEQQGAMIGDYVDLQTKLHSPEFQKISPADQAYYLNQWDKANQALAPYLRQLVGQPKLDDPKGDIFHLEKLDLKPPPAPGPPPAALTGTAVPLKEIGGTSVYANPPSPLSQSLAPKLKVPAYLPDTGQ